MIDEKLYRTMIYGILDQGAPSVGSDGKSAYRGLGGLRSPVGFLIDDDLYIGQPYIENWEPSSPAVCTIVGNSVGVRVSMRQEGVLHEIEDAHNQSIDSDDFIRDFIEALVFYAKAAPFDTNQTALYMMEKWCQENERVYDFPGLY